MIEFKPVSTDEEWDRLLADQPGATFFHALPWLRCIRDIRRYELLTMSIRHDGRCVGLFPMFLSRRGLIRVCSSSFRSDSPYLGPLVRPELLDEVLARLGDWAAQRRVGYSVITFPHELPDGLPLSRPFCRERRETIVVDLTGTEQEVFGRCRKRCREVIRRSRRRGVEIIEGDLRPFVDRHAEMGKAVLARKGHRPLFGRDDLLRILDALAPTGRLLTVRAMLGPQVIGSCLFAHFGRTLYSLHFASDYAYARYGANTLMVWHGMSWANRHGLEELDFTGGGTPSLCFWKESFGGVHRPIARLTLARGVMATTFMGLFRRGLKPWIRLKRRAAARLKPSCRRLDPEQPGTE